MISTISISDVLRERIAEDARAAYPKECCGLIEGMVTNQEARVLAIHATRNLADAPDRFEIDPAEHIRLQRAARNVGNAIIGCYHSHPNGSAEPSPHDRESAAEEDFLWLIAALDSGKTPRLSAFIWQDAAFRPVPLAAIEAATV